MSIKNQAHIDQQTAESKLEVLDDNFLACRDIRHLWEVTRDFYVYEMAHEASKKTPKGALIVARDLKCPRCKTLRREVYVQRTWGIEKIRNTYSYASGYRVHGIPRGVTPSNVIHNIQYRRSMERLANKMKAV